MTKRVKHDSRTEIANAKCFGKTHHGRTGTMGI